MSNTSSGPVTFFTSDHRACDELWSQVEEAAGAGKGEATRAAWERFDAAMRRHFAMEEEVLFPAVEEAMGAPAGPTQVMRMEHQQMRSVLDRMADEASRDRYDALVEQGDTLLMLIQQHNVKEEQVLYPMAEQLTAGAWPELAKRLEGYR